MSRTCAEAVRAHRNLMARLIAKRFHRFKLSPYAYQRVLLGAHFHDGSHDRPWLVRLRCFVPDPNAEEPWCMSPYPNDRAGSDDQQLRFGGVGCPSTGGEDGGFLDRAFDDLPSPPQPVVFVEMRDPHYDVHQPNLLRALERGEPVHEDGELDNPYWLNGFSNVLSVDHVEQWGLAEVGDHADIIAAVNTALGTQFPDLERMWMPAGQRPGTPVMFASMAHPLWCTHLVGNNQERLSKGLVLCYGQTHGQTWCSVGGGAYTTCRHAQPCPRYCKHHGSGRCFLPDFFSPCLKPGAHPSMLWPPGEQRRRGALTIVASVL